ncbi:MAG: hypothetical protein A2Z34_03820 [Planctomycetes bacterium RBG_16_59_8]|nr:MAG: hypothetical protein A2Z34_03820 [Planctomycetes bacterium RBG_16_59_8]
MKRLLILSASAGTGHLRAAEALEVAAREEFPDLHAVHHDALDLTNRFFKSVYGKSYILMVNHTPSLWGLLYKNMERNVERKNLDRAVKMYDKIAYKGLRKLVEAERPDALLCTHFLPANVAIAQFGGKVPVSVVVTDYDVHKFWINPGVARYFVATDEVAWQMARYGIPADRIEATGIPIHPRFSRRKGIRKKGRTLLVVSSGFGGGDMVEIFRRLCAVDADFQLTMIAGKNEKMRSRLAELASSAPRPVKVFGFVDNIEDHMEGADLVVTKAGGLTVSECLARRLPMVIFSPIPGQEERNCDYLLEQGVAVKAKNIDLLDFKVRELMTDGKRLNAMSSAAAKIAHPRAAFDILRRTMDAD